ncbi:MAG: 4Fe-4S binding protein [Spirochaetales bacterium]|nr:4Fe-4S binding protein [Spirochaetales bacterium]
MKYNKLKLIYFSPAGTTRRTLENIAEGCGIDHIESIDITDFDTRWKTHEFGPDELVLIGMPVYAGRIPAPVALFFNRVKVDGAACVPVVVYGNRAYEDALLELKNIAEACGFYTVAAGAFIAEHSLCSSVARGRPDAADREQQADFGRRIMSMLESSDRRDEPIVVPGNFPYKNGMDLPFSPEAGENCNLCGDCVPVCPVKAIDPRKPSRTDELRCILCGACIKACPLGARTMLHPRLQSLESGIAKIGNERKPAELFI